MQKVVVLGCGMVGQAIARDLGKKYNVLAVDKSEEAIRKLNGLRGIRTNCLDLSMQTNIRKVIHDADLVVNATPGFMGFSVLKTIIEIGKNVVDIAFFPEDALTLQEFAKKQNVTTVVDFGVAPGMCNLFVGYHYKQMQVKKYKCLVGGLPRVRNFPYEYKAPFSPSDVLEEYTRPARIKLNNEIITRPALSEPELVDFDQAGTLEAFLTDGLRSLLYTLDIPNMVEKTLRYPGHRQLMEIIRETGFLSTDETDINGKMIKPIDLTTKLLFPIWKLAEKEPEFTAMEVTVSGVENGTDRTYKYSLFDEYDPVTNVSSMARTTGYACCAMADMILSDKFKQKGLFTPEMIGFEEENYTYILKYLKERNINYTIKQTGE